MTPCGPSDWKSSIGTLVARQCFAPCKYHANTRENSKKEKFLFYLPLNWTMRIIKCWENFPTPIFDNLVNNQSLLTPYQEESTMKATFDDFCVWKRHTSDSEPSQKEFERMTDRQLQKVLSEANRMRRIEKETEALNAKAKRMAEHFAKFG